jgi:O-antigen ligase
MVLVFVYLATGPNAVAKLGKAAVIGAVALAALWLIPVGERLVDLFPFLGPPDLYRERLFDNAILVIRRSPWFGSIDYMSTPEMQMMIQGEGIIDIVNTYLQVALKSGLVGLGLFVGFFVTILIGLRRVLKFEVVRELGFDASIRASIATLVAMLVEIGTVSSVDFIPYVYWSFAGLWVALIRIAYRERATVMRAVRASRVPA